VEESGRRCTERNHLEFHHNHRPYSRGGDHHPSNIQLVCRTHNAYMAERDYGKEVMQRYKKYRRPSNRVSEPSAVYNFGNRTTQAH
jgi:hypothetical protein